jgi:hypothetical protein
MTQNPIEILKFLYQDIRNQPLYYGTMILGILGAACASDASAFIRSIGYFVWLFSNGYLLIQYYNHKNIAMTTMFIFYEVMNLRGLINNIWFC